MALRCSVCRTEIPFEGAGAPTYCEAHHVVIIGDDVELVLVALRATREELSASEARLLDESDERIVELVTFIESRRR